MDIIHITNKQTDARRPADRSPSPYHATMLAAVALEITGLDCPGIYRTATYARDIATSEAISRAHEAAIIAVSIAEYRSRGINLNSPAWTAIAAARTAIATVWPA